MIDEERHGNVALWAIRRPEAKNALNLDTLRKLADLFRGASKDSALRAIVLTGKGGTFASGGDLRELRGRENAEDAALVWTLGSEVTRAIAEVHVPVVAAVEGVAIGGGAELACACDMLVGDETASFSFKHARLGVTTAWGTTARLRELVGHGHAARLLLTSQTIDARQALSLGLLQAMVPKGEACATALAWTMDIEQGAPSAVTELKALLRSRSARSELIREEMDSFVRTWQGDEHREAVSAYFSTRSPRW